MSVKRRKYTSEFREQTARLVIETGRPVAHVAAEIGVGEQVLGRWVRLQRQAASAGDTGAVLDADERAELERVRRENAELCLDRVFFKKPRPSSSPNTTGRGLPGDRSGEGQLPDQAHVRTAGRVTLGVLQLAQIPATVDRPRPPGAAPSWTPRSPSSTRLLTAFTAPRPSWPTCAPTVSGCLAKQWRPRCAATAWPASALAGSR
jgi:transposase-like protein